MSRPASSCSSSIHSIASATRPWQGKDESDAELSDAAISPDGSSWLLLGGPDELSLLRGEDRRQLPASHWWVSALTYTTDGPVLAVLPSWVGGTDATARAEWDKPPFLLRLDDQTWKTLRVQEDLKLSGGDEKKPPVMPSFEQIKGERDIKLAAGRNGALWTAQQNAYFLRRYSRQGVAEESVAVSGGHIQWKERTEENWKALEKAAGRTLDRSHRLGAAAVRVDWQRLEDAKWKAVPEAVAEHPRKQ